MLRKSLLCACLILMSSASMSLPAADVLPVAETIVVEPTLEQIRTDAIRRAARELGIDSVTYLQVSRQENFRGIPDAWSPNRCCFGIVQINLRTWYGEFHDECGGSDLIDPYISACYGAHIYLDAFNQCTGKLRCTLRVWYLGPKGKTPSPEGNEFIDLVLSRPKD